MKKEKTVSQTMEVDVCDICEREYDKHKDPRSQGFMAVVDHRQATRHLLCKECYSELFTPWFTYQNATYSRSEEAFRKSQKIKPTV